MRDVKPVRDTLELCGIATAMLKGAGFVLHCASRRSEACYYKWPGREELLRVAARSKDEVDGLGNVVARITFDGTCLTGPGLMRISDDKIEQVVAAGIGRYFLARRYPRPSARWRMISRRTLPTSILTAVRRGLKPPRASLPPLFSQQIEQRE